MGTIFEIKNEDLQRLRPIEAVNFFRELIWAEARIKKIPISKIHISILTNIPDGGIDAVVEESSLEYSDLIKSGQTAYQIKTGTSFKPWQDSAIRAELFNTHDPERKYLASGIRNCLDNNGTYILVCFGLDLVDSQHRKAVELIENHLKGCAYKNPKVEVWSLNNLIGFLKPFPSLSLKVNRRGELIFQTYQSWSRDSEMRKDFIAGKKQTEFISNIQTELRQSTDAVHIRVWGEPGIGKTRLVFEATRVDDLRALVIYCDTAGKFRDSELMSEILRDDNTFSVILVIDECDPDSRSYIWNKVKYLGPRIKIITIYNDYEETSGKINYIDVPPLEEEQVGEIIQNYGVPKDQVRRWADLCSGSPRVAHVFGQNLISNPEDLLKSPDTINIWDRYIVGSDDSGSSEVRQRKLVLKYLALFRRFGYGKPVIEESQAIAAKIAAADASITWSRFQEIINELKQRKILQGESTLYITPKALHIKLWIDWWNVHGEGFDIEKFSDGLPGKLLEWFYEMFKYAASSQVASRIVKELLSEIGPFYRNKYLETKLGPPFFLALSEADPQSALDFLKKTIGRLNKEELLQFTTGRREVVWALERMAIWKNLFADAARLLLILGEAENETWGNNASGAFADLFSMGYGRVASTEAPPEERLPILKEALYSDSREMRLLALRACEKALESQHFSRVVGAEYQGLRKEPELWMPKTYGEIFNAYRSIWELLSERLGTLPDDEKQQAVDVLVNRSRGLQRMENLADMVMDTFNDLIQKPYVDKKKILTKAVEVLHYEGKELTEKTRKGWEKLRNDLTGTDFSSLLKRFVGMSLVEDDYDLEGKRTNLSEKRIKELAEQAKNDISLLKPELKWVVTNDAQNGHSFGYELGIIDNNFSLLPLLLKVQRNSGENGSVFFIGGYFRALFEKEQKTWEKELTALAGDDTLNKWLPEIIWRSGMSDEAASLLLNLARKEVIKINQFKIFTYGNSIKSVSENAFHEWIYFLLDNADSETISMMLRLFHYYYLHHRKNLILPEKLTFKLLTHHSLFQFESQKAREQRDEYDWTEIGKEFVKLYPGRSFEIADVMLEHLGDDNSIFDDYFSQTLEVLNAILLKNPGEIWKRVTKYIGPPIDSRAYNITQWLRGGEHRALKEGAISVIPLDNIWEWVDEDVNQRAWYLASFIPNKLYIRTGEICLSREVLIRYGEDEHVRRNLRSNFSTESYWGPRSEHLSSKADDLLKIRNIESNENVKQWIDEYVSILKKEIVQARIDEERRGY
ncbi:MAG: hypothetical protein HZB30_11135 [Nitrospirae bacterium]|nr:hypothetical protein [Nitrospirota bacterium]